MDLLRRAAPARQLEARSLAERMAEATKDAEITMAALLFKPLLEGTLTLQDIRQHGGGLDVALLTQNCAEVRRRRRQRQKGQAHLS